jgi:SNF2 family DNA or RNA helicase
MRDRARQLLLDPGPDIVVADEAHVCKNKKAAITKVFAQFRTRRRVFLTGTPMQNHLIEYVNADDTRREFDMHLNCNSPRTIHASTMRLSHSFPRSPISHAFPRPFPRHFLAISSPFPRHFLRYFTMINLVREMHLGTEKEFTNQYANPIAQGQSKNSHKVGHVPHCSY